MDYKNFYMHTDCTERGGVDLLAIAAHCSSNWFNYANPIDIETLSVFARVRKVILNRTAFVEWSR